ncbi:NADH-quinone oxidoreductase subunit L [Dermatophilaceae bacterium Soc4.6]
MSVVVRLVVLLPALAALLGILLGLIRPHRVAAAGLAVGAAAVGVALALVDLVGSGGAVGPDGGPLEISTIGPLPAGDLVVPLHLLLDRPSAVVALAVTVVGLAVQLFSVWYLADDERYPVFAAEVSLFLAGMLLVVHSGDLVLTLVGWEVMGWCSYLLIGHVSARESARRAALKAFLVTRVADLGFVLGIVVLAHGAGSTRIADVLAQRSGYGWFAYAPLTGETSGGGQASTLALVALLVGVAGKSGLVPFHDWLPDAMEGPTPASALIHAATMVAAGTVVLARLEPLYAADPTARAVLAVLAAVTMVWAALLACVQADLKRMLAYSTLSQIAIMLAALAVTSDPDPSLRYADYLPSPQPGELAASASAGLSHLVGHALFKSLLFLAVGWLSVLAGGTAVAALRGRARGRGALTWALGIGLASLAGVPPLVGFFSKDGVVTVVEESLGNGWSAWFLLLALLLTVALTAAYSMRAWLLLTTEPSLAAAEAAEAAEAVDGADGQSEDAEPAAAAGDEAPTGGHEARPVSLAAALVVATLAVLTALGGLGLLLLPGGLHLGWLSAALSVLLVAGAAYLVWTRSPAGADAADLVPERLRARAQNGFGVDVAYVAVARGVVGLATVVATVDRVTLDAYPALVARSVNAAGRTADGGHRGSPSAGLVAVLVGVVVVAVAGVTLWS